MSLTSRIQALTAYANEVTGESDTTLADAVATLAEGYGQGGGGNLADFSAGNITALVFNGPEYIVTDYLGSLNNIFSMKFMDNEITSPYEYYFSVAYNNACTSIQRENRQWIISFRTNSTSNSANKVLESGVPTIITLSCINSKANNNANLPLVIAHGYYNGAMESQNSAFTFYGLNIMNDQGEFVARFMPWLENGVACVKDLVSGNLFYNAGTGTIGYIE